MSEGVCICVHVCRYCIFMNVCIPVCMCLCVHVYVSVCIHFYMKLKNVFTISVNDHVGILMGIVLNL